MFEENDARGTREVIFRISKARAAFNKDTALFTSTLGLNLRKRLFKCYIWIVPLYSAEIWTLQKIDRKYLESCEMWSWRRMEKINWTDCEKCEEVLRGVKEGINILHTAQRREANWIGHMSRRNCTMNYIIKEITEEKI